jgi:mono/diheme cytochrome c family protein
MIPAARMLLARWRFGYFVPFFIMGIVLVLANWNGFADTDTQASSARVKQGAELFQKNCVSCHNKQEGDTSPFGPPNLHGIFSGSNPVMTPEKATELIKGGKSPMPAFEAVLTPAQINALIAYLKTQ